MPRLALSALLLGGLAAGLFVADPPDAAAQQKKKEKAAPKATKPPTATPPGTMKVAKGFKVELVYTVPKDVQGSWVCMTADPKGRLIVSDQYGDLYRVTPAAAGGETKIEKIPAKAGMAQGLLWAFDSLYAVVNTKDGGLYRVTSSKNDDVLDRAELLRKLDGGGGEHGHHAVMLHPDGKRLTVVCGNQSKLAALSGSRVPLHWGEDHLLPRVPDGNGFMKGVLAPGGCIYHVTPDGKDWELVSMGYRNQYDAAYNRAGDLFTYDADMEWDYNTPWYRPTRVCQAVPGSDWGWRNGAGKYPTHYADTLPPVVDIGPGSPTGVAFGYGARFPAKYQEAFYICDWSYGKLYAVHMTPAGAGYTATAEEFIAGTPLPLTDLCVSPADGALYFAVGGRKTQSALYRVTYTGPESTAAVTAPPARTPQAEQRLALEKYLGKPDPAAVAAAWPHLGSPDRVLRYTARAVLEFQPPAEWQDKALAEADPQASLTALLGLVRASAPCPLHAKPGSPKPDPAVRDAVLAALFRLDFAKLTHPQRLEYLRVAQVALSRFGAPETAAAAVVTRKLDLLCPTGDRFEDGMLLELLVYLQSPTAAAKGVKLLADALTQEEQLEYVRSLRELTAGWTPDLRKEYFTWFVKAANYKGGNSFQGFLRLIKADAVAKLSPADKLALQPILDAKPAATAATAAARPFVKKWTLDEVTGVLEKGLAGGRDFDRGRKLFAATNCYACHRYGNEGGANGPDLTGIAGRFSPRDLAESIIDPNKEISDQYAAVVVETADGRKVTGRIVNLNGDGINLNTDMLNPNGIVTVNRNNIDSITPSKVSMMPAGLLDTLHDDELLDLMAFLLSRGDKAGPMFRR